MFIWDSKILLFILFSLDHDRIRKKSLLHKWSVRFKSEVTVYYMYSVYIIMLFRMIYSDHGNV